MDQSYPYQSDINDSGTTTPKSSSSDVNSDAERYDDSATPKHFKSLTDVYNAT